MTGKEALEELKTFPTNCLDFSENQALQIAIYALEKVQQFEAVGTIEEFKALKEKNVEKKPIRRKGMCYAKAKDGTEDYEIIEECPTCKNRLYAVSFNVGYCRCGQKITV